MTTNINFNRMYIVESLASNERKTGTNIYNDALKYRTQPFLNQSIDAELCDIESKAELLKLFKRINSNISKRNELPYLHFEMHGTEDGMVLKTEEIIKWNEVSHELRKINIACNNNLFVSMSMCYGAYLIRCFDDFSQPCPLYGFVGPLNDIGDRDLEVEYTEYFAKLLDTNNFRIAFEGLQEINTDNQNEYIFLTSGILFDRMIENLTSKSEQVKARKNLYEAARKNSRFKSWSDNKLRVKMNQLQRIEEPKIIEEMKAKFTMNKYQ